MIVDAEYDTIDDKSVSFFNDLSVIVVCGYDKQFEIFRVFDSMVVPSDSAAFESVKKEVLVQKIRWVPVIINVKIKKGGWSGLYVTGYWSDQIEEKMLVHVTGVYVEREITKCVELAMGRYQKG